MIEVITTTKPFLLYGWFRKRLARLISFIDYIFIIYYFKLNLLSLLILPLSKNIEKTPSILILGPLY